MKRTQFYPIERDDLLWGDIYGGEQTKQRNARIVLSLLQGAPAKRLAGRFGISYERVRQIWMLTSLRQQRRRDRDGIFS